MPVNERYPYRYALYMMAYYLSNAVYQGYITVYFAEIGLSTAQIGLLMSFVPVALIACQMFWGARGDRAKNRSALIRNMLLFSALVMLGFSLTTRYAHLMVLLWTFAAFFIPAQPLADSVILESLWEKRKPFGILRLSASFAFALGSLAAGRVLEGRVELLPYITSGLLACAGLATFALPSLPGHGRKENKVSFSAIFRLPHMPGLFALVLLIQVTLGYFYSFFPVYFTALPGSGTSLLGLAYLISAASETPFLLFADRLYNRIGVGRLLCVAAAALTVRWTVLALTSNPVVVLLSQLLHGWGFIIVTVGMAKYLNDHVPGELKARAQAALSLVGAGLARVVGNLGGGLLGEAVGIQNGFFVVACVTFAALAVFAPIYFRQKPLNGEA